LNGAETTTLGMVGRRFDHYRSGTPHHRGVGHMDVPRAGRKWAADGASLVSILLIVVVLGGLSATAIVGVNSLTGSSDNIGTIGSTGTVAANTNTSTTVRSVVGGIGADVGAAAVAACNASASAANSAASLYYATSGGAYPVKWSDLTAAKPPLFPLATGAVINVGIPTELDGRGWKMSMTGGGTTAPMFTCSARPPSGS
jgi:hypothetical protein